MKRKKERVMKVVEGRRRHGYWSKGLRWAAGGGSEVDGCWSLEEEEKEEDNDNNGEDEGKDVERKIPDTRIYSKIC